MKWFFIPRLPDGKGFTLVEAIFTISILALVLVAMAPFIRTVYISWNLGDRKTELQQNARVGLEMISRSLRQAKRITGIPPSGSGNFVRFRNWADNQTIIFYHNMPTSTYYYNNTASLIRDNDLVMRNMTTTSVTNALLAKSLNNFRIDFRDNTQAITTRPYNVSSLDITMNLSDPQGLIPDTIDIFSTLSLRPEVRINPPVWVAAGSYVVELSNDNWITGFSSPNAVSVNSVLLVNGRETVWVADTDNNRICRIYWNGSNWTFDSISGFSRPRSVSVNPNETSYDRETCWVADTNNNYIRRIYWNGSVWAYDTITGGSGNNRFSNPYCVSVNPNERVNGRATCWATDTSRNRIRRIYWNGSSWTFDTITGFSSPRSVSVNFNEIVNGRATCWVADTGGNRVRKIYWNGATAYTYANLGMGTGSSPSSVSVNTTDGTCWVANSGTNSTNGNRVRKLSGPGTSPISILFTVTGFRQPNFVSVNPNIDPASGQSGVCWVADTRNNQVVKLDSDGNEEFRISGFTNPLSVTGSP